MINRKTGEKIFESMPICEFYVMGHQLFVQALTSDVRVGMHLLFVTASSLMSYASVEALLISQSVRRALETRQIEKI